MVISSILTLLSLGWKLLDAVSNIDFVFQKVGLQESVANFLATRGPDVAVIVALGALVLSLLFQASHAQEHLDKRQYVTHPINETDKSKNTEHTKTFDIIDDLLKQQKEDKASYERQINELTTKYQQEKASLIKAHSVEIKKHKEEIDSLKSQIDELNRLIAVRDAEAAALQQKIDSQTPKVRIIVGNQPPYLEEGYIEDSNDARRYQYKAYIGVENFGNVTIEDLRVEIVGLKIGKEICPRIPLREKKDTTPYKLLSTLTPVDILKTYCLAEHIKSKDHITLCTATPETTPTEIPIGSYQFYIVISCRNFPISVKQRVNMFSGSLRIPFTVTLLND